MLGVQDRALPSSTHCCRYVRQRLSSLPRDHPPQQALAATGSMPLATGRTIITSQLPVSAWHGVIGDPTYADAILDRLVHNAHRIELNGESPRRNLPRKA